MKIFDELRKIIEELPEPTSPVYEARARLCLEQFLSLDKNMKTMKKLETLKHIRRELNIIAEVVTQQQNVIKQMTEDLQDEELRWFKSSNDLKRRRVRRAEKLEQRRNLIQSLDKRAGAIFNSVSLPDKGLGGWYSLTTTLARALDSTKRATCAQPPSILLKQALSEIRLVWQCYSRFHGYHHRLRKWRCSN